MEQMNQHKMFRTRELATFVRSQISGDLKEVPGISVDNKAILNEVGINNTYQLIGKYLTLKNGTRREHHDAMWAWFQNIGVRSDLIKTSIEALLEKCDAMMPHNYDDVSFEASEECVEFSLSNFFRKRIAGDFKEVPGVGPANKAILKGEGVNNTYQLIGKYLILKNGTAREHQDAMWKWLQEIGVRSDRHLIVLALAKKCDIMMPGILDPEQDREMSEVALPLLN